MTQPITIEIAFENGELLFRTSSMSDLQFLNIPETVEGFPVTNLSVGTTFAILPNEHGTGGTYRVTTIKTYIASSVDNGDISDANDKHNLNLTYIVEKVA
jgi:hypothetical protein